MAVRKDGLMDGWADDLDGCMDGGMDVLVDG